MRASNRCTSCHGLLAPGGVAEERLDVGAHLGGQPRARLEQAEHDAGQPQPVVQPAAHQVDRLQQLAQAVQGEEVRLQRQEHVVDRRQGVDRENAQRRRAVDEHVVELRPVDAGGLGQRVAQDQLAAHDAGQLDLGGGQVDVRRRRPTGSARPAATLRPAAGRR